MYWYIMLLFVTTCIPRNVLLPDLGLVNYPSHVIHVRKQIVFVEFMNWYIMSRKIREV